MVVIRLPIVVLAILALAGCTSDADPTRGSTTDASSTTEAPEPASVEAAYGCGPSDAAQVRVSGRVAGSDDVVILVAFDGTVYDRSWPKTGPKVGEVFDTKLPQAAFDAGSAEVRIVDADDRTDVIVQGEVDLRLGGGCG